MSAWLTHTSGAPREQPINRIRTVALLSTWVFTFNLFVFVACCILSQPSLLWPWRFCTIFAVETAELNTSQFSVSRPFCHHSLLM